MLFITFTDARFVLLPRAVEGHSTAQVKGGRLTEDQLAGGFLFAREASWPHKHKYTPENPSGFLFLMAYELWAAGYSEGVA